MSGDFNINMLANTSAKRHFAQPIQQFGSINMNTSFTLMTPTYSSLLNFLIINMHISYFKAVVIRTDTSNHYGI